MVMDWLAVNWMMDFSYRLEVSTINEKSSLHLSFSLSFLFIFIQWSVTVNWELSIYDVIDTQKNSNED